MIQRLKKILVLSLMCSSAMAQFPKSYISGKVCTTNGKPAEFISIFIEKTSIGTVTDKHGNFKITLDAGDYTLLFSSLLTKKKKLKLQVKENETLELPVTYLEERQQNLDEVVVTGYSSALSVSNSIYKTHVISDKMIREKGATRLEDILNTSAGFRMQPDNMLGETNFELMGAGGNNLKILIDGVPLLDRGENKQSLSQTDLSTIKRIEIIEGPMSVLYGTDALAGVINIITQSGKLHTDKYTDINITFHEESLGATYTPGFGNGVHRHAFSGKFGLKNGWYGGANATHYTNGGWKENSLQRNYTLNPKKQFLSDVYGGYSNSAFNIRYRMGYMNEGIKAKGREAADKATDDEFNSGRFTHQLYASFTGSKWKVENSASLQLYNRETYRTLVHLKSGTAEVKENRDNSHYASWFDRLTFFWHPTRTISLLTGWEIQADKGYGNRVKGNHKIVSNALFASLDYNITNSLQIRAGLRGVVQSTDNQLRTLPSVHLKWKATSTTTLRASTAYGFRTPKLRELYFDFQDSDHNIVGNPELGPEKSINFAGSVTQRFFSGSNILLESQLSGFYNAFSHKIIQVTSTQNDGQYTYANSDKHKTTGVSLQNRLNTSSLSADVTFSYIGRYTLFDKARTEGTESINSFRFSPEVSFSASYFIKPLKTSCSIFYKFTGSRYNYSYNPLLKFMLLGTESYHWADFTLSKKMCSWLTIQAGVKNLFNVTSIQDNDPTGHLSGNQRFIGSGRSYFCSFALKVL